MALSKGKSVLFSSTNEAATRAFMDKVPPKLRWMCMNISGFQAKDIESVRNDVEDFIYNLREVQKNPDHYKDQIAVSCYLNYLHGIRLAY